MTILSLFLVFSSSIVGTFGESTINNQQTAAIKAKAIEALGDVIDKYNFENYTTEINIMESFVKQEILNYAEKEGILDSEMIAAGKEFLANDPDFVKVENIESLYLINGGITNPAEDYNPSNPRGPGRGGRVVGKSSVGPGMGFDNQGDDIPGWNAESLPFRNSANNTNHTIGINENFEDSTFIGITLSKDTCINFYNFIANWLNNEALGDASDALEIIGYINIYSSIIAVSVLGEIIGALTGYFTGIFQSLMSIIYTAGPIGLLVGVIASIMIVSIVFIVVSMFVFGYLEMGYQVGFRIYSLFDWDWYEGPLY